MMHMKLAAALAAAATLAATRASAEGERPSASSGASSAPRFGRAGTLVLGDVVGARTYAPAVSLGMLGASGMFSAGWLSFGNVEVAAGTVSHARIDPSFDVFVADGASLGATVGAGVFHLQQMGDLTAWDAGAIPRIGYAFSVGEQIAVWPRLGMGLTVFDGSGQDRVGTILRGMFDVPFVFRASRHAALTFGPELSYVNHLSGPTVARGVSGGARAGLALIF